MRELLGLVAVADLGCLVAGKMEKRRGFWRWWTRGVFGGFGVVWWLFSTAFWLCFWWFGGRFWVWVFGCCSI
uniref:Putative ovule protein n=1 Tax=Solanum chacoense TaxID=4108 RepID=A0A0V0GSI4_SOLCH